MNGADRFQLSLDNSGRKKNGIGNVVRTHICVQGMIPAEVIKSRIFQNTAVKFLNSINPKRKWFSTKYYWTKSSRQKIDEVLSLHTVDEPTPIIEKLLQHDCDFLQNKQIHIDVVYEKKERTHVILTVNHSLLDYTGIELLLQSISTNEMISDLEKKTNKPNSFIKKFIETVQVTFFVAARSGWAIQALKKSDSPAIPASQSILLLNSEWPDSRHKHKGLALYLAGVCKSLNDHPHLLEKPGLDMFVPTPLDRRTAEQKNTLLSNHLSFLFFKIQSKDLVDLEKTRKLLLQQILLQAKRNIPAKFQSLMNLFSYLPAWIYDAFINLPSKGKSSTFAFSALPKSFLANGSFMDYKVLDYTHFPPFLSPPALNIVFEEVNAGLKITTAYDQKRISQKELNSLLLDIKNNLTRN